ncbi:anhydro-N-acetylmuramic acid kinase AnmK [Heyndrickxia sp. NPDC080065]|uniref:anhydro-N-acetylmuramic acid kinase AnmK n=1 Tax=Heyndrickxia sp. NPDC080065 TaxID=3390568 RepID=UPI003CFF56AE
MEKLVVGLMSGTSLDGIDAALVKINDFGIRTKVELIHFITLPFSAELKKDILQCMDIQISNVAFLTSMNFKLGRLFAEAVKKVCAEANVPLTRIDAIGSHGQTVYHLPTAYGDYVKSTLQIGEPAIIAYETGVTVVSNFRAMDMAAGGEGAPLVPYTDYLIYQSDTKGRALQNIGGIGNVTVLPKGGTLNHLYAFDTGPGNMIIDEVCRKRIGLPYDPNGEWASKGKVHKHIVDLWMQQKYFHVSPPKSTGRELFGTHFTEKVLKEYPALSNQDLIATVTYFTAYSIADAYKKFVFPNVPIDEMIVGGGGSYNRTLIRLLKELMPNIAIYIQEDIGYSSDAKEAIAFSILANETIHQQYSNVPRATGSKEQVILGSITLPPNGDPNFIYKGRGQL